MPNEQNLISNSERTPSELREIAQKGGIASGAARRRKKSLKEAADLLLSLPVADQRTANKMRRMGLADGDIDNQMAIIVGLQLKAMNGSDKCARLLFELLGDEDAAGRPGQTESHSALIDAIKERNRET